MTASPGLGQQENQRKHRIHKATVLENRGAVGGAIAAVARRAINRGAVTAVARRAINQVSRIQESHHSAARNTTSRGSVELGHCANLAQRTRPWLFDVGRLFDKLNRVVHNFTNHSDIRRCSAN